MANQRAASKHVSVWGRIPLIVMTLFVFMGFLGLFFLTYTERSVIFYFANGLMHIPLVLGWVIITFKSKLERRLHPLWTPFSLFLIFFVATTVLFTSLQHQGVLGFLTLSETFWYALAYGLLFAFYKLESANPYGISCSFLLFSGICKQSCLPLRPLDFSGQWRVLLLCKAISCILMTSGIRGAGSSQTCF